MAILKPYTFVAGTKAKASEVNADFDTLYTEVNSLDTSITQIEADVETLDTTKANINGSTSNRFSVANPVNSYDAVNKQYLFNSIGNSLPYINGLGLAIDNTDTIHVDAGSCYDSELTTLMVLSTSVSKQNTEQSANTTYYVYLIATDGSTTDVLISTSSGSPALPTGYTKYRRIGYYKTNSDNKITVISEDGQKGKATVTRTYSSGSSGYMVFSNGLCVQWGKYHGTIGAYTAHAVSLALTYANTDYITLATGSPADYIVGAYPDTTSSFNIRARFYDDDLGSYTITTDVYWTTIGQLA